MEKELKAIKPIGQSDYRPLAWFSTVLLLRHYSSKVEKLLYWILVSIPLVFFLSQFQTVILNIFLPLRLADPFTVGIVTTLTFNSTKTVGRILFGIAFWGNQPLGLTFLPYPPFGLVTILFLGLASYLVVVGVYSSAL